MHLNGEVAQWAEKSVISVFRVPLLAVVMQIVCLLMKYGTTKPDLVTSLEKNVEQAKLQEQTLHVNANLWDWFRWTIVFKMSAESVNTIFLSLNYRSLSRWTFIVTAIAALIGVVGGLFYGYRLVVGMREMKRKFGDLNPQIPVDGRHVYGGILYFNPSDSAWFSRKYIFNFANKWAWLFIACVIAYPLLVFWPA